jgi:tRNA G18 (ribose-2'-O)-methylase SpoU
MPAMKVQTSVLILENIRSAQNVGALFRTADAAGVSKIYLVGYTPDPVDRFLRPRSDIAKAALGAEKTIPWEHAKTISPLLKKLAKDGFQIISIEQSETSIDYKKIKTTGKVAFILGNEVDGVSKTALANSHYIAEIPMKGEKESLNVSVAGGIALFRMLGI